ncbi:MAG TPA: hypothetical protein VJ785_08765 [Anaerolineales bacterium]|nr:hypothetical protein [Anaerolineales bacterium]
MHIIDSLPLWAVYLLTVGLCLLAEELGFLLGKSWKKRHPQASESQIGPMIAATLGLWAFLLAFLVGNAASRFDARRDLVVNEANSIGTTFLRAGYLPEPYTSESRALLKEYANERLRLVELDTYLPARQRLEEIQVGLWGIAEQLAESQPPNPLLALYITSLNETIDLHTNRITVLTVGRVPFTIYAGMYLVAFLGLLMLGFQSGIGGYRDLFATIVLIAIFSGIMLLIIDLDRPWGGLLRVSQQPMQDLIDSFSSFK